MLQPPTKSNEYVPRYFLSVPRPISRLIFATGYHGLSGKSSLLPSNHQESLILPHIQLRSSRQPGNSTIITQKSQVPIRQSIHRIRINLTLIFHCPLHVVAISTHCISSLTLKNLQSSSHYSPKTHRAAAHHPQSGNKLPPAWNIPQIPNRALHHRGSS